ATRLQKHLLYYAKRYTKTRKMKVNGNLNLKIITEAKELGINFDSHEFESSLQLARDGNEIVEWLEGKNIGGFCQNSNMNLFILEQLLNEKGNKNYKQATDKKDLARTYKGGKNLYAVKIPIQPVNKNKIEIEHWNRNDDKENSIQEGPKLKRCQGCNDEQKEQSRGCLLQRNFKSNRKAIDKKLIRKSNEKGERELLVLIKLFNFKLSINEVTTEQIKKKPAVSYLAIELLEEKMLKECIKGKEVIDELLTITRKLIKKK
ncbi:37145_t:CDS:2, partial [Gigaspora margarita]